MSFRPDVTVPQGSDEGTINPLKVTTSKIAANAVTGPKIAPSSQLMLGFTGHNGAGACTLTGAKVGDMVQGIVNMTDGGSAATSFEATITVVNQIQQTGVQNFSAKRFAGLILVRS